ncbi:hypothetical protein [Kribbella amoyensis]|uniref:hypothetical protein n=1 Tax=Kribbella amoyensis TaxID=996641 RepID=UPI0011A3F977|nr:hypothetical protein [Kribbella amoyensis]
MVSRVAGTMLLASGLLGIAALGTAGGYGVGLLTSADAQTSGSPAPIGSTTPTPTEPVKTGLPDNTPALDKGDLRYKTRSFVADWAVRSNVTVKVPSNWWMTQPDPKKEARFTDPTGKRFVRIEAGFTITRPPTASLEAKIQALRGVPPSQALKILSRDVADDGRTATLVYTYIPQESVRHVVVRWVALDDSGNCAVEISAGGLPQDEQAVRDVLEHATDTVTRTDQAT